ncbi:alginate lyase family protein, partial [Bacteroidota bacterium]
PGMDDVKKAYNNGNIEEAKVAYLEFRRKESKAKWHINPRNKPGKPVSSQYPGANKIMEHIIPSSMGAPETYLGEDINWEYNPVDPSEEHFTVEWIWCNLNRMGFWDTMGRAYWHTLDEKYAEEWVNQMTDWIEDNPVPLDEPHYATLCWRSIESGIRMSGSWMNAYYYFLHSPSFTTQAHVTFVKGIIGHGWRLKKITMDRPERTGNWVIMECNGLGTIGILFPELLEADEFRKVAFNKMNIELDRQVYPDGAQIELTTSYHQVSRRNFMELAELARMNDVSLPEGYLAKLKRMYEFNLKLMDPSGYLPPFNDARPVYVIESLHEAYLVWNDKEFLYGASLGKKGRKPGYDSYFFNYAGYYVMRSGWNYSDNCLYFDAGPVGFGHLHEDMLNLYLYSHGKVLLIEPGNYTYDKSKWRKYVLSTAAHNTITVDGKGQHRSDIPESRLIEEPLKNPWVNTPMFDYGKGIYNSGYQKSKYKKVQYTPVEYIGNKDSSICHTRHVFFLKPNYYIILDFLEGEGEHNYEAYFHLNAPDAEMDIKSMTVHTLRNDEIQLGLYPMDIENLNGKIIKGQEDPVLGWIPGEKRAIPTVVYSKEENAPAIFSTLLFPYLNDKPLVSYETKMENNGKLWAKEINTPYENISLIIRKNQQNTNMVIDSAFHSSFSANADIILIRKPADNDDNYFGFLEISEYNDDNLSFHFVSPSSLLMVKMIDGKNGNFLYNPKDEKLEINFTRPFDRKMFLPERRWVKITSSGIKELANPQQLEFFNKIRR